MSDRTGRKQADTRFKPGQSGNPAGRPKGSRNKLSEDFFAALAADFAKHGKQALEAMRNDKPSEYIRAVVALQSKEVTGEDGAPIAIGVIEYPGLDD